MNRAVGVVAAVALAAVIAVVAANDRGSGAATTEAAGASLPAPVRCYRDAVNRRALAKLVRCFAPRGVVVDVSRRFTGRTAIRAWAESEVIGGRLTVIRRVTRPRNPRGLTLLVRFAPAGSGGFLAHYRFVTRDRQIVLADLQYAR